MNKYKINPLLIPIKEKEQTIHADYVLLFWVCKTHTPILNGIVFLVTGKFFSRNQMETRQENVNSFSLVFAKLLMYEHCSYKKDVWMELINGIVSMNIVYELLISVLRIVGY